VDLSGLPLSHFLLPHVGSVSGRGRAAAARLESESPSIQVALLEKMALTELPEAQKSELIVSLAALLCEDADVAITSENLNSAIEASGNKVPAYWTVLFASMLEKSGGVEKFCGKPGSGGGGGGGGAAAPAAGGAAAAPAAEAKKEEEEEEEIDMGGGMSMFGEAEAGGGDY
ncbi:unnamed protein product, partial [Phaeothamnion confervicola]